MGEATEVKEVQHTVLMEGAVKIEDIKIESNFRKRFNADRLAQMAETMKGPAGVIEPVILRERIKGDNPPELVLVAGERRIRAAKIAGLVMVPARVLGLTEAEALQIQALENLHRENLTPIEEARAFQSLIESGSYDVKACAEQVSKHLVYVYRALQLLELPAKVIEAIDKGELSPAHGHEILRVPKEHMDRILKGLFSKANVGMTAKVLREQIEQSIGRDLTKAKFPKNKEYAGKVACDKCPFNSGNQGMLFDGAQKGRCTNAPCFDEKSALETKEFAESISEKFKAMKFLGIKKGYQFEVPKGMKEFAEWELKDEKIKKLMAENPEMFGVGILLNSYRENERTVVFVALSAAAFRKEIPQQSSGGQPKKESKKERELRKFGDSKILQEICMSSAKGFSKQHLSAIALHVAVNNSTINDAFGMVNGLNVDSLRKWHEAKIVQFIAASIACDSYSGNLNEKTARAFGINVAKIRAEAKKEMAQIAGKKAPVKKEKKKK